jgi:hypothetical protein
VQRMAPQFRDLRRRERREQLPRPHLAPRRGNPDDVQEGEVPLGALDLADVVAVEGCEFGEVFLGELPLRPQLAAYPGHNDQNPSNSNAVTLITDRPMGTSGRKGPPQRSGSEGDDRRSAADHRPWTRRGVVVSVEEYQRVKDDRTGEALVKMLQESPLGDINLDRPRIRSRVRSVKQGDRSSR